MLGLMDDRYQVAVKRVLRHEFHSIKTKLSLMLANRLQHKNVLSYLVSIAANDSMKLVSCCILREVPLTL